MNRLLAETQVRGGHRSRLLRVINEVALHIQFGLFADDLDGVLVGAHRPIRAQAEEHGAYRIHGFSRERRVIVEAGMGDIVDDADSEVVLRSWLFQLFINASHHCWREFLGRQTVSPADDLRELSHRGLARREAFGQGSDHVQIERLADASRFLGAVQHGNALHRRRQRLQEVLDRERTHQPHL